MTATRGYDNLYNERINDIALMNYNKGIANRLRMQEQQMQTKLPFKEPQMLSGGVRASNSIIPGTTAEPPSTLAVGGRAFRTFTGNELPSQGGVNRLKKANRYLDFSKKAIGDAFDVYDEAKKRGALNMASMAGMGSGGVNRLKKANRYSDFSKKVTDDAFNIYDKVKARGGMVYSQDLKDALSGCGVKKLKEEKPKKPRTARFVKGSPEAKAWGEKMKQARMKQK